MSGINNTQARQFNVKAMDHETKQKVTVRLAPGFNSVKEEHWDVAKTCDYVKRLKEEGKIEFGDEWDDKELKVDPDTVSKSKSEPLPKTNIHTPE